MIRALRTLPHWRTWGRAWCPSGDWTWLGNGQSPYLVLHRIKVNPNFKNAGYNLFQCRPPRLGTVVSLPQTQARGPKTVAKRCPSDTSGSQTASTT